ncbi:sensor histidine kinase [Rheinheimera oceanensis]|uniref:sensor histidine kinase n=1 Tax=Rheinheimera oceanensis TaxID=2817449 RepID=UPI001BFD5254|nr:sensor histidine kinase [Rheinheimera oceanensis]
MPGSLLNSARTSWFILGLVMMCLIGFNAYLAISSIKELTHTQTSLTNTGDNIVKLDDLHLSVLSAESGQRGYLLTDNIIYLEPYQAALSRVREQITEVQAIKSEIPEQQLRINEIIRLADAKIAELTEIVGLAQQNKDELALRLLKTDRGKNIYLEFRTLFDITRQVEKSYRESLLLRLTKGRDDARLNFILSGVLSSVLVILMLILSFINVKKERKYLAALESKNEELALKVEERTQELRLYSEELSRSNRELEDFAFVASHDLQEPLRKIQAFGDRLEASFSQDLGEQGLDYMKRMRNAAQRMSLLINDLLDFSRINTRGRDFAATNLNDIVNGALDDLEIAVAESNAQIDIGNLPVIQADSSQLSQLFLNLLSNSLKFRIPDRTPVITITAAVHQPNIMQQAICPDWYVITLTDNGIGFAIEYAEKIFTPFQRLHGRSEYKGTGIGLAVCRRIVERHRGLIYASGEPGVGATFTLILPADGTPFGSRGETE